jgi:O-Antigen ligase/Tetratricopeptide repeat
MGGGQARYWLAESPALVPRLVVTALLVVLGATEAGFYPTSWMPAGLFLVALTGVTAFAIGAPRNVPRATLAALGLFAAYAAWTFLSIAWADQKAVAWEGANRTAIYLLIFALFTLWPGDERGGRLVIGLFGLGVAGVGVVELLRADASTEPLGYFIGARLAEPAGYINANVALWTLGLLACVFTAASRETPTWVRPLCLGGAGVLAGLATLGQSRGWALALPAALVLFVLVTSGRVRLLFAIGAVGIATLAQRERLLSVHNDFGSEPIDALLHDATVGILVASGVLAVAGLAWALADRRIELQEAVARRLGQAVAVIAVIAVAGAVVVAVSGDALGGISDRWEEFKEGGGPESGETRFASGGSNRWDFWTVAWELFEEEPVRGIGIENFQVEYLRRGSSEERPQFPHSFELGVLSQTGLIGAVLLGGALLMALVAAWQVRSTRRGRRAVAGAAVGIAAYWLLHASVDWFWEFAALTGTAMAMLGLAGALAPRRGLAGEEARHSSRLRLPAAVAVGVAAGALAISIALPWASELLVRDASTNWTDDPEAAFDQLDTAASLNPLSNVPQLTAASIALEIGDVPRARAEFAEALEHDPESAYALLELGAIAAERGERADALALLRRALALTPRDEILRQTLRDVRAGRGVSVDALNEQIRERARSQAEN